jgi:hypothetical protein
MSHKLINSEVDIFVESFDGSPLPVKFMLESEPVATKGCFEPLRAINEKHDDEDAVFLTQVTENEECCTEMLCGIEGHVEDLVNVSVTMETSIEDVYTTGAMARVEEWQAVISAGNSATTLTILTKEKGVAVIARRASPVRLHRRRSCRRYPVSRQ